MWYMQVWFRILISLILFVFGIIYLHSEKNKIMHMVGIIHIFLSGMIFMLILVNETYLTC